MELRPNKEGYSEVNLIHYDPKTKKEYIPAQHILVCALPGRGKSFLSKRILEQFHKLGYIIIILTHKPYFASEVLFSLFEPQSPYHINLLKKQGTKPNKYNIITYAPFSFNLKKFALKKLNDIKFFTIPIKSNSTDEFKLLLETNSKSDEVNLCEKVSKSLRDDQNLFDFMYYVEKGLKKENTKEFNIPKIGNKYYFFLDTQTSGNIKTVSTIIKFFSKFNYDYFLSSNNSKYNLDFKEILTNQKDWHFLDTEFLESRKFGHYTTIWFMNRILENIGYCRHPILFYVPEGKIFLTQSSDERYVNISAKILGEKLSGIRNLGSTTCSTLCDTQQIFMIHEEYRENVNFEYYGNLSNNDIDRICKTQGFNANLRRRISGGLEKGEWIIKGESDDDRIQQVLAPSSAHADEGMDFMYLYKKFYPDKLKDYKPLIKDFEELKKLEENKSYERKKRDIEDYKKKLERLKLEKHKEENKKKKFVSVEEKEKEIKSKEKEILIEKCYNEATAMLNTMGKINWSEVSRIVGIRDKTCKNYYDLFKKRKDEMSKQE